MNVKIFQFLIFFIYLITTTIAQIESINLKDLDDLVQCFHLEKMTFGENEEITYELINNKLDKILFLQFKDIVSVHIYKSDIDNSNLIFSRTKEENKISNFENHYFNIEKHIEKYYIKVEFLLSDINEYKMCFNLLDIKGNSFKTIPGKSQKVASYEIINSGKFPLFINEDMTPFTALRINKKYQQYFTITNFNIKTKLLNSEETLELNINKFFDTEEYQYIFWNLNIKKSKNIKEIFIEINVNINKYEEGKNKLEIELIKNQEIHYEYEIHTKICEDCPKIFYIDLKKYIFAQDMDILSFANVQNSALYISNSYNINKENSINLDKMFYVFNRNYFDNEKYNNLNINPDLLFLIIDEKFFYSTFDLIFSFVLAGSSHQKYQYHEDITKGDIFKNNRLIINSRPNSNFFLINYFSDSEIEYIMDYEPILGKANIYYSNSIYFSKVIPDYLDKVDLFPIHFMNNSIIHGNYGIFKINCESGTDHIFSFLNIYKKNEINDVIYFNNNKALLYIKKDETHSFTLDSNLLNEKFSFRIRILKKDEGKYNIEIKYNDLIYQTLKENNFLELKHEKGENPIIYIKISENNNGNKEKNEKGIILELIKELNIEPNLFEIKKSNIYDSTLISNKIFYFEYDKKNSNKVRLNLHNEENDEVNICIHTGYGVYPYLIKPLCTTEELIKLKKGESLNLVYENPFNDKTIKNVNSDNHFYVSLNSSNNLKYDYLYEKYSIFDSNSEYKYLDFNGKEIIQLNNNKGYPYIYYQINLCQNLNTNFPIDSFKPLTFNYYFEGKKDKVILNNIKNDIYTYYKINTDNSKPNIIFTKDETINGKFKYMFSPFVDFNLQENFSKEIKVEQLTNKLKIQFETPYKGDLILYFLFIASDFDKYNDICNVIDLFDNLRDNQGSENYYSYKLYKKELSINDITNKLDIDIESKEIIGINRKDAKLYVINRLKIINMDLFYNPYKLHINFNDRFTKIENEQNITQKIVIIIVCLVVIFIIFIFYRNNQRKKRLNEINFERKNISLSEDVNESNKLF